MDENLVKVENLKKWFPLTSGFFRSLTSKERLFVRAVDGINFEVKKQEIFGLVGESGSGKTTTGRLLLKLIEPTDGKIFFHGEDISLIREKKFKILRRKMQLIFQDPYESLNPRMTIYDIVSEPVIVQELVSETATEEKVCRVLESVELIPPEEFFYRYPHELSGGQRQRVAVARALILNPEFIVADEPVSMLDVSIRAGILDLMHNLVERFKASFLYITHDLALARHMCDRIAIMYLGKIMEKASTEKIVYESLHPYTRSLIMAVPVPDPTVKRSEVVIKGEIPSPINPPSGCRFHTRCPIAELPLCSTKEPPLDKHEKDHYAACHLIGSSSWKNFMAP